MILRLFMIHLHNISDISLNNCFNTRSKIDMMFIITFGHYATTGGLQRFHRVMNVMIVYCLDYAYT